MRRDRSNMGKSPTAREAVLPASSVKDRTAALFLEGAASVHWIGVRHVINLTAKRATTPRTQAMSQGLKSQCHSAQVAAIQIAKIKSSPNLLDGFFP